MRLAEKYGYDPHVWHDNVEIMMLNKSKPKYYRDPVVKSGYCNGLQPVVYVDKIMEYYANYKAFYQKRDLNKTIGSL
jgi:membrane-bound lytic murein transglycosylase F